MMPGAEYLEELPPGAVISTRRKYEQFVPGLVEHPGKWVRADDGLDSVKASSLCSTIRRRRLKAFQATGLKGRFEAERVSHGNGEYSVYARYVEPDDSEF